MRRAAAEIIALHLSIAGPLNNADNMQKRPTNNAQGWDLTFATNHLGPFALTEALAPHLPDGATVVFVVSADEDAERTPAAAAGFRGGRYVSAEASARGESRPGGQGSGLRRVRDIQAGDARRNAGVGARVFTAALQRRRAGRQRKHQSRTRRQRPRSLSGEIFRSVARAAVHALHEILEHAEASRTRDRENPDRPLRSDRRLLRRERPADARLGARARPEVPRPTCPETRAPLSTAQAELPGAGREPRRIGDDRSQPAGEKK